MNEPVHSWLRDGIIGADGPPAHENDAVCRPDRFILPVVNCQVSAS